MREINLDEGEMRELYEGGGRTQLEIAEHFGVSQALIWKKMDAAGMKARSSYETRRLRGIGRKYSLNEDFFKTWTVESAWFYGWFLGDGNLNQKTLRFGLSRLDKEVLYKIREAIQSEHPITDYDHFNKITGNISHMTRIDFGSKELINDIKTLNYREIPEALFPHFLRGFFEAEGWFCWDNASHCIVSGMGNNDGDLLGFLQSKLLDTFHVINGGSLRPYHKGKSWMLRFSKRDTIAFYSFVYNNCHNMYLKSKREKFGKLEEKYNA